MMVSVTASGPGLGLELALALEPPPTRLPPPPPLVPVVPPPPDDLVVDSTTIVDSCDCVFDSVFACVFACGCDCDCVFDGASGSVVAMVAGENCILVLISSSAQVIAAYAMPRLYEWRSISKEEGDMGWGELPNTPSLAVPNPPSRSDTLSTGCGSCCDGDGSRCCMSLTLSPDQCCKRPGRGGVEW